MPIYRLGDEEPRVPSSCWIAPGAQVAGRVSLGEGVSIWFNAVVRGDVDAIFIGDGSNIQDGCVCHVDPGSPLVIGERVIVGHQALLHGCTIENEVLIGMGATVLNRARIGRGSIVAAGALVKEDQVIPPFSLVAGLPAVVKRELDEEEILAELRFAAELYDLELERYRHQMSVVDHA